MLAWWLLWWHEGRGNLDGDPAAAMGQDEGRGLQGRVSHRDTIGGGLRSLRELASVILRYKNVSSSGGMPRAPSAE